MGTTGDRGTFRDVTVSFDAAIAKLPEELKKEGFGVVTEIDLKKTFAAKLGVDFRRYTIFGACNPTLAHGAVSTDPHVGVLLPCNVVLYERDDGKVVVGAIDPMQSIGEGGDGRFADVARDVQARLGRVLDGMSALR